MTTFILLSHDVDWGKRGAPKEHILARKDRFDAETLANLDRKNPYQNIAELLEIEEKLDVRSTFFFRTRVADSTSPPPTYDATDYAPEMQSMRAGGWEIGLHLDPASYHEVARIEQEKTALERVAGTPVFGNRVHWTLNDAKLYAALRRLNFTYDSSLKHCRERIVEEDFGYSRSNGVIVFPITFMDALVFAYLAKTEADVLKVVKQTIRISQNLHQANPIVTLLWHDCALKMKFGRKYRQVLEFLTSLKNVSVKRGIDLAKMVAKGEL